MNLALWGGILEERIDDKGLYGSRALPSHIIKRHSLVTKIQQSLESAQLVLVMGPEGSGRSTLLAQWAAQRKGFDHGVWLSLDNDEAAEWSRAWQKLLNAFQAAPFAHRSPLLATLSVELGNELVHRFGQAVQALGIPVVLILEGGDNHRNETLLEEMITLLLHVPNLKLLISGQAILGDIGLKLLKVKYELIPADELFFTRKEVEDFLVSELGQEAGWVCDAVYTQTRGFPQLLRLLVPGFSKLEAQHWEGHLSDISRSFYERFGQKPLRDGGLLQFVAETSLCSTNRITVDIAQSVTGLTTTEVRRNFETLNALGFGIWQKNFGREPFTYHDVFEPLIAPIQQELSEERRREIHQVFALSHIENDSASPAMIHCILAGDWKLLRQLVIRYVFTLRIEDGDALLDYFHLIDDRVFAHDPVMLSFRAVIRNAREHTAAAGQQDGAAAFSAAMVGISSSVIGVERLALEYVILQTLRGIGQWQALAERLPLVIEHVDHCEKVFTEPWQREFLEVMHLFIAISYLRLGDDDRAVVAANRVLQSLGFSRAPGKVHAHAKSILAWVMGTRGEIVAAEKILRELRDQQTPFGWKDWYFGTHYRLAEAGVALEKGRYEEAAEHLKVLEPMLPRLEHWADVTIIKATYLLLTEGPESGSNYLGETIESTLKQNHWSPVVKSVNLAFWNAFDFAGGVRNRFLENLRREASPNSWVRTGLNISLLYSGDLESAAVEALKTSETPGIGPRLKNLQMLVAAVALWLAGNTAQAISTFHSAALISLTHQLSAPLRLMPKESGAQLLEAWRQERWSMLTSSQQKLVEVWPEPAGVEPRQRIQLTQRERELLGLLSKQLSAQEIADRLFIALNTVKSTRRNLYKKLGASSRHEAVSIAVAHGLLDQ